MLLAQYITCLRPFLCVVYHLGFIHCCVCVCIMCVSRARKLHEDRQSEMQQTLTQMNDRTEQLEKVAEERATISKHKAQLETHIQVCIVV